jgi:hypothetical protein
VADRQNQELVLTRRPIGTVKARNKINKLNVSLQFTAIRRDVLSKSLAVRARSGGMIFGRLCKGK